MLSRKANGMEPAAMGKGRGHTPIRTCVSCGARKGKSELTRLVLDETGLWRDDPGSGKGRGRYLCKKEACREQLMKNRRLHGVLGSKNLARA